MCGCTTGVWLNTMLIDKRFTFYCFTFLISAAARLLWLFTIPVLSIVRIWSSAIIPILPLYFTEVRVGYFFRFDVIGAITIVLRYLFISSGEMITQGHVFLISLPVVGSRLTRTMAYCSISTLRYYRLLKHHPLATHHLRSDSFFWMHFPHFFSGYF